MEHPTETNPKPLVIEITGRRQASRNPLSVVRRQRSHTDLPARDTITKMWFPGPGTPIEPAALAVPKARQLADFLASGAHQWARLLDTRCTIGPDRADTIVAEVDVEVGQNPIHDIQPVERIAVTFLESDRHWPEVLALRSDFPRDIPHLYPREDGEPCSLCLYEDSYAELKLHWTGPRFVERIRDWLRETSRSTLHGADQPLEPVFAGRYDSLEGSRRVGPAGHNGGGPVSGPSWTRTLFPWGIIIKGRSPDARLAPAAIVFRLLWCYEAGQRGSEVSRLFTSRTPPARPSTRDRRLGRTESCRVWAGVNRTRKRPPDWDRDRPSPPRL